MKHLIILAPLLFASCSMRPLYGPLGAALGGGVGSIAGPAGAAIGAGAGAAGGQLLAGDQELKKAQQTIGALSRGDVEGLIAAGMGQQKGFMDEALDAVYGFVKLCLVGIVLWQLVPILYTRYIHKKHTNGNVEKIKS